MKNVSILPLSIFLIALFTFTSCQKEQVAELADDTQITEEIQQTENDDRYYTPSLDDFVESRSGYWTEIPAGSTDALTQAITEADPGGIIYLKAGMHTETDRVTIDKRIKLIGETGAVLRVTSSDTVSVARPGIHVLNAPGTAIQNIEVEPLDDRSLVGILFEGSPNSAVLSCKVSGFPNCIVAEQSDRLALINNTVTGSSNQGVLIFNAESSYIGHNEFIDNATGIWACDKWGTVEGNTFSQHVNEGLFLCKFPAIFGVTIPGNSDPIGAEFTCTGWKIRNNVFSGNPGRGLTIRDGANLNRIENNNQFTNNGVYDILIPADATILGGALFIPAARNNTINVAPDVLIKDCGDDNIIIGGDLVDTSVDPC